MIRRALALTSISVPFGGLLGASPAAASDLDNYFNVYNLKAQSLKISSGSCRELTVTAETNAPAEVDDVWAEVDVWHGSDYTGSAWLFSEGDPTQLSGSYMYCPLRRAGHLPTRAHAESRPRRVQDRGSEWRARDGHARGDGGPPSLVRS